MLTSEQRRQMDEEGYFLLENAIEPIGLERVRESYDKVQNETEEAWRQSVIVGTYTGGYGNGPNAHTMSPDHSKDTTFLELANNPKVIPLLEKIVGPEVQVHEMLCHCHHSGTDAHTAWHRDWPPWNHPQYILKAKVFYFLDDQDEEMGCFSLVPGSHKSPNPAPKDQYMGPALEEMPGMKKMIGAAGSAIIWNVLCWHTGLANTSRKDRRLIIYGYMPFWVKKWGATTPQKHIVDWANTPQRRQIMGIHCVHGRRGWDRADVPYLPEHEEIANAKKL